jgi:hypothetical protein
MLSATKHLGPRVRSFAEFTLSETNVLRMTHVKVANIDVYWDPLLHPPDVQSRTPPKCSACLDGFTIIPWLYAENALWVTLCLRLLVVR